MQRYGMNEDFKPWIRPIMNLIIKINKMATCRINLILTKFINAIFWYN